MSLQVRTPRKLCTSVCGPVGQQVFGASSSISDTIRGWFTRLIEELTASVDATTLNGRRERRAVCVPITRLDSGLSVTALAEAIGS